MRRIIGLVAVTLVIASVALALHSTAEARTLSTKCQPWPSCRTTAPTPTPVPTPPPTPTPTPPPGVDPFAAWTPPAYHLSYNGDNQPFPYANEPQPAARVYVVRERADLTWTYANYGYSPIAHDTKSLTEDDAWDRVFEGYLAPGETAAIRVPLCQDPSQPPGWGVLCAGGIGIDAWYASSEPTLTGVLVTPSQGSIPLDPRATAEHQGWAYFGPHAFRGSTFNNGSIAAGSGYRWYTQPYGGTFWVRITNPSSRYAPLVIRVKADMAHWLAQAYYASPADRDLDIQPVDAPALDDPRLPYPVPPTIDYDGYTYDGALGAFWNGARDIVPDYPR